MNYNLLIENLYFQVRFCIQKSLMRSVYILRGEQDFTLKKDFMNIRMRIKMLRVENVILLCPFPAKTDVGNCVKTVRRRVG